MATVETPSETVGVKWPRGRPTPAEAVLIERRRDEVAAFVQSGGTMREAASRWNISESAARNDCRSRGVDVRGRYHVEINCSLAGCEETRTVKRSDVARGLGKYCCAEHYHEAQISLSDRLTKAELLELIVLRYFVEGLSLSEAGRLLGLEPIVVMRHLESAGYDRRPARRPRVAGEWVTCKCGCGRTRWIHDSQGFEYLSAACWARARWTQGSGLQPLVSQWGGRARQRWLGRWGGRKEPGVGAQPRGRPAVTLVPTKQAEALRLRERGWGRRAIADRLQESERAVRNFLDAA